MTDIHLPMPASIIEIREETADKTIKTFTLALSNNNQANQFDFQPGQFIELFLPGKGEFPVGIASSPMEKGIIKLTVKKSGVVTRHLHSSNVGDTVGIRGPLGKPFPWDKMTGKTIVLIGGGFAFTTLRSSIHYMMAPENREQFKEIHVVYGATNPDFVLYRTELEEWSKNGEGIRISLTVDRTNGLPWNYSTGLVPEIVRKEVPEGMDNAVALVCGPPIMVKFTIPVLDNLNYQHNQICLSLENRMKCGVGLCGRCNIGPRFVCVDGPVFTLEELQNLPNEF